MNSKSILNSYQNQILNKIAPGKKTWERQRGLDRSCSIIQNRERMKQGKVQAVDKVSMANMRFIFS